MKKVFNAATGEHDYLPDDETPGPAKPSPLKTKRTMGNLGQSSTKGEPKSGAERKRLFRLRHGDNYRKAHAQYMRDRRAEG